MEYVHGGDIYTDEGMTDFSANINPLGPGAAVLLAAHASLEAISHYPDARCRRLRSALSGVLAVEPEYLVFGNGAAELIFLITAADRPRRAVLVTPSFAEYKQALAASGCEVVNYQLQEADGFQLDASYLDCLTPDVDMIFLCSPANPVGNVIDRKLLLKILERCRKYQIRMVMDECFYEFLDTWQTDTLQQEVILNPQLFVLRAFTKMHAMPGLRLGYGMCSDTELIQRMEQLRQPWSISVVAQAAGLAAVYDSGHVSRTRSLIRTEREWMMAELTRIGITFFPPRANYIFLKSSYSLDEELKAKKILIRNCSNYDGLENGYYRIAIRCRKENQLLIDALTEVYESAVSWKGTG